MCRLVAAAALATLVVSPAFTQSYDPSVGSGNITAPSPSDLAPESPAARRGLIYVRLNCARCHAVDQVSPSPVKDAPPLRALHIRYPVSDLQRPLAEGIHPNMPLFRLTAGQLADVMAYLKALER